MLTRWLRGSILYFRLHRSIPWRRLSRLQFCNFDTNILTDVRLAFHLRCRHCLLPASHPRPRPFLDRMHRVLQHKLLSSSHTVHRPCSRLISGRRHATRVRNFHRSSTRCLPKGPQNGGDPVESGGEPEPSNEETRSSAPIAGNGQSETALAKIPPKALTYYGSAARRHLRRNNAKDSEHPVISPKWFRDANVRLHDESKSAAASPIQLVLPTPWKGYVGLPKREAKQAEGDLKQEADSDTMKVDSSLQDGVSGDKLGREPVPLPGKRYFVDLPSFTEVYYTAEGLLRLPHPSFAGEVAAEKSHLVLHYPVEGGSFLLDEVVEKLSHRMRCDLVVLDAQDISELVASSPDLDNPPEEFMHASRLLSYEVYNSKDQRFAPEDYAAEEDEDPFELESSGDTNRPKGFRMGRPMIIAKTMNLSDLLGSAVAGSGARGRSRMSRSFLGGLSGEASHRPKSPKHILAPLVDGLVSTPQLMRVLKSAGKTDAGVPDKANEIVESIAAHEDTSRRKGLIIHVKDLRSIQDTEFGGQFLSALYENVQQRRMSGEPIIIIGTEVWNEEAATYSKPRIQDIQKGDQHEISRNILLSPVAPNTDAKLALSEDKRRRIRIINMRHLLEQYGQRDVEALLQLPDNFWTLDPTEYLGISDWSLLETSHLSFGEIHRLSALLAGMSSEEPFGPGRLQRALRHLTASDQIKFDWAEQGRSKDRPVSDDKTSKLRKTATKHEKHLLGGVIEPDKIKTTFNDVHAPIETIEALKTLTTLSLIRPDAFLYGVLATDKIPGLLLYGPPGTGKTLLAKAVAKESGAAMLEVSAAEINDMYVGEGEKNVKALFSVAKKLSPCVSALSVVASCCRCPSA
jgi:hypothetical protein